MLNFRGLQRPRKFFNNENFPIYGRYCGALPRRHLCTKASLNNLLLCSSGIYATQPSPQHCTTGKSLRGCDQLHPVVLQPFDSVSQHCPTFYPDNTTIVHMGKYQSIIQSLFGLKWYTLLSLARLPKQLHLTLHT